MKTAQEALSQLSDDFLARSAQDEKRIQAAQLAYRAMCARRRFERGPAAATYPLGGMARNLHALSIFTTWEDQGDRFRRIRRAMKEAQALHLDADCGVLLVLVDQLVPMFPSKS